MVQFRDPRLQAHTSLWIHADNHKPQRTVTTKIPRSWSIEKNTIRFAFKPHPWVGFEIEVARSKNISREEECYCCVIDVQWCCVGALHSWPSEDDKDVSVSSCYSVFILFLFLILHSCSSSSQSSAFFRSLLASVAMWVVVTKKPIFLSMNSRWIFFFMVEELLRIIELRLKGKFFGKVAGLVLLGLGEEMWFYVSDSRRGVFWIFVEGC